MKYPVRAPALTPMFYTLFYIPYSQPLADRSEGYFILILAVKYDILIKLGPQYIKYNTVWARTRAQVGPGPDVPTALGPSGLGAKILIF